ncbi:MAG: hypothetical protein U9Q30_00555 [Campylobacterota bacterium]|nr:hypothetical protein [Campylobacterota bacterium]
MIKNQEFQNMLKNSSYTKEQSLIFNNEHKIIDLLIKKDDSYIVVDYKTTLQKSYQHIKQVSNYTQGIKDITKSENVKSCLVYLHKDNIDIVF